MDDDEFPPEQKASAGQSPAVWSMCLTGAAGATADWKCKSGYCQRAAVRGNDLFGIARFPGAVATMGQLQRQATLVGKRKLFPISKIASLFTSQRQAARVHQFGWPYCRFPLGAFAGGPASGPGALWHSRSGVCVRHKGPGQLVRAGIFLSATLAI
jgi:hypothetical protein